MLKFSLKKLSIDPKLLTSQVFSFLTIITNIRGNSIFNLFLLLFFVGNDYYDTEMDKEFLLDLRKLGILVEKDKEHKQ